MLLNPEDVGNEYIEDCEVCCRPMEFKVVDDGRGGLDAIIRSEND